MKQFFPRIPFGSFRVLTAGNKTKRPMSVLSLRSPLTLILISLAAAAVLLTFVASASKRASSGASLSTAINNGRDAHAPRRTVDQDLLPRLNLSFVAKTLQGGESRQGYRSRLLKRRVIRLHDQCLLGSTCILGKGPAVQAEDRVARLELRYIPADGFDLARHITAGPCAFLFT
jgi:hypothetical protein